MIYILLIHDLYITCTSGRISLIYIKEKKCVGRESNPDRLLGRQPLHHRRFMHLLLVQLKLINFKTNICSITGTI